MAFLNALDDLRAELQAQFPGWNIWYVPHTNRTVTWCAQPLPLLNEDSPEHLADAIREAQVVASATSSPGGCVAWGAAQDD